MLAQNISTICLPTIKSFLKRNAVLSRNGTIVKGDSIDYDMKNETWKAKGNDLGEQKRIQLVNSPVSAELHSTYRDPLMATLEARNLAKAYGKRPIVKDVSMSVKAGRNCRAAGPQRGRQDNLSSI